VADQFVDALIPDEESGVYSGRIVGKETQYAGQESVGGIIRYDLLLFERLPTPDEIVTIQYKDGAAAII